MIKPTITLNGTSPRELRDEYMKVKQALDAALHAFNNFPIHGRDYRNEDEFRLALGDWRESSHVLLSLQHDVTELILHCQNEIEGGRL